jgi:hypothetical protein
MRPLLNGGTLDGRENERMSAKDDWPREKRWKHVYTRSAKLARAQKLGFDYPRVTRSHAVQGQTNSASGGKRNVLFICSKNQWRSPTAETVWRKHPDLSVRSAGTSSTARRKVSVDDIRWADVIFVIPSPKPWPVVPRFSAGLPDVAPPSMRSWSPPLNLGAP